MRCDGAEPARELPVPEQLDELEGLDASFRRALDARLAVQQRWPEWLPELAYVAGGVFATAAILALPFPVSGTWWIGSALAGLGLVAHSLVARVMCEMDVPGGC